MIPYIHPQLKTRLSRYQNGWFCEESTDFFPDKSGFTHFIRDELLSETDKKARDFYDERASVYDENLPMTFYTHNENETELRKSFIAKLNLKPDSKVLEIACGTGRDSEFIAEQLTDNGNLVLLDISENMLETCRKRFKNSTKQIQYVVSNATELPFEDHTFDAIYSFGGIGEFSDIQKALQEMVRVTKVGGKVVFGDESMPEWLRGTYFSNVLMTTNPQFKAEIPFKDIPVEARKFNLSYVIGGVFYLIDFEVGKGEPTGNFDFPIPGLRGGTLRTRYEGQLEGVTKQTKEKLIQHCKTNGISIHDFLEKAINSELGD